MVEAMEKDSGVRPRGAQGRRRRHRQRACACRSRPTPSASTVSRPVVAETTALGAAYAAGLGVGFWKDPEELRAELAGGPALVPADQPDQRDEGYAGWPKAVQRTLDWVDVDVTRTGSPYRLGTDHHDCAPWQPTA